jgi:hypothetical protein
MVKRENLTLRQLLRRLAGGRGNRVLAGTPELIADHIIHWVEARAADGFNLMPPYLPGGQTDFVEHVVPCCSSGACSGGTTRARCCGTTTALPGRRAGLRRERGDGRGKAGIEHRTRRWPRPRLVDGCVTKRGICCDELRKLPDDEGRFGVLVLGIADRSRSRI